LVPLPFSPIPTDSTMRSTKFTRRFSWRQHFRTLPDFALACLLRETWRKSGGGGSLQKNFPTSKHRIITWCPMQCSLCSLFNLLVKPNPHFSLLLSQTSEFLYTHTHTHTHTMQRTILRLNRASLPLLSPSFRSLPVVSSSLISSFRSSSQPAFVGPSRVSMRSFATNTMDEGELRK